MYSFRKRVGYCITLLAVLSVFTFIPDVNAKQASVGTDSLATNACKSALFGENSMLTADKAGKKIVISALEGSWKIKYIIEEDTTSVDYSLLLGKKANQSMIKTMDYKGGEPAEVYVGPGNAIFLIAEPLQNSNGHVKGADGKKLVVNYTNSNGEAKTTTCKAGTVSLDTSGKITINNTAAYISKKFAGKSKITIDPNINTGSQEYKECEAMKNAKYNVDDAASYLATQADINAYVNQMKVSFPYCFNAYDSSFEITADTIKQVRQTSVKAYKSYLDLKNAQKDNPEYEAASIEIKADNYKYKELPANKDAIEFDDPLTCTKTQKNEKTKRYYTSKVTAQNSMCKVTCQELVQITYDPPQATKAGLCFQYKVTIKSKVACKTEITGDISWPTPPSICSYTPICGDNDQETQAGPIEEFDSCVKTCDGGKYSQSCINKCYDKVYGKKKNKSKVTKTSTNTLFSGSNSNVLRLQNASDPYSVPGCTTNAEIQANAVNCANAFYRIKQQYPYGTYVKNTAAPAWIEYYWTPVPGVPGTSNSPSSDNWVDSIKRSAPYYFRDAATALKTIQSFYGVNSGTNGYGDARTYIIDNGGVKRQVTSSFKCDEVCGFVSSDDSGTNCVNNSDELRQYFIDSFGKIESELSQCTANAECKEDEATFKMSVDNSVMKDKNTEDKSKWKAKNTSSNPNTCISPTGDIEMYIPLVTDLETGNEDSECSINPNGINGKCYGKDNPNYWQHYKTTITFPGTWIDLKTAKRYYDKDDYDKNTMKEKKNYYCVGYDYEPVNEKWWDWKINHNSDENLADSITVEDKDNIKASIAKFGKFNWSVDVNCFYGLSNLVEVPITPPPTEIDECSNENSTELCNVEFRPTNQQNMFPTKDGVGSRYDTQDVGFNWTSAAKDVSSENVKNSSYGLDPAVYADELQKAAASNPNISYSGPTDYHIHLTKENIKALRDYVKENGYTSYQGNNKNSSPEGVEGLYYYTTNLDVPKYIKTFDRKNNILGYNND